jgi:hypothetical protein
MTLYPPNLPEFGFLRCAQPKTGLALGLLFGGRLRCWLPTLLSNKRPSSGNMVLVLYHTSGPVPYVKGVTIAGVRAWGIR